MSIAPRRTRLSATMYWTLASPQGGSRPDDRRYAANAVTKIARARRASSARPWAMAAARYHVVRPVMPRYRSLADGLRGDVGRAIAMAAGGALAFAPIEYAITLWAYAGSCSPWAKLRLIALTATLALLLWLVLAVALAAIVAARRLVRARIDPAAAGEPGLFAPSPLAGGIRPGVPLVWASVATCALLAIAIQRAGAWALVQYKEPQLIAGLVAVIAVGAAIVAIPVLRGLAFAATAGARALVPLGPLSPLGRWRAAGVALAGLAGAGLA